VFRSGATPDRLRSKEGHGSGEITVLAQHHVDQGAIAIKRAIQILPTVVDRDIRLVDISAAPTKILCQCRRKLCLPITDGLMAEDKLADEEQLGSRPDPIG